MQHSAIACRLSLADRQAPIPVQHGKVVDALELISGWRIRQLLWTTLTAIVLDICIMAVVTLLTGSGEMRLAAGSYAAAIEALLMALLTL
jgi:hypothetical protein